MEENVQDIQPQNNVEKTNSKFPTLLVTSLIVIIALLLLLILYLFFVNNKSTNNSSKQSTNIQKIKTSTTKNLNSNNTCKTEGTATSAMFPINLYPNQPSQNTLLQDQNTASKNWESDAYLITSIVFEGITAGPNPHGAYIYASGCTKDFLVYYGSGSGPYTSPTTNQSYDKPVIVNNFTNFVIPFNFSQLPYNTILPLSEAKNFPSFVTPHKNGPIIYNNTNYSNPSSTANNITISNKSFYAQQYTVQVNNSKKLGIFYDVMFYNTNNNNLVALATISSTGTLLTLKLY